MSSYVENLLGHFVQVISIEGRVFIGELNSYDQLMNIILKNCIERIFNKEKGVREEKSEIIKKEIREKNHDEEAV